jgi:hypothetical protein
MKRIKRVHGGWIVQVRRPDGKYLNTTGKIYFTEEAAKLALKALS